MKFLINNKDSIHIPSFVALCVLIELLNILLSESLLNLVVTLPQVLFVLFLIFTGNLNKACFFNLLFTVLCFNTDYGLTESENLLSYAKIKIVGPLTLSYALGGVVWILTRIKYPKIQGKETLIYKFYNVIRYLLVSGSIIGIIGIGLWSYPLEYFIRPLVYVVNAYIYLEMFLRTYDKQNAKRYHDVAFCLLVASPIATFLSFFVFNVRGVYSVFEALITNEIYTYVPCLLIVLLTGTKHKALAILGIICYFVNLMAAARGAYYMTTTIALVICVYLIYFSKQEMNKNVRKIAKIAFPLIVILFGTYIFVHLDDGGMASQKFEQFLSLGNFFFQSGSYEFSPETISSSPYIRIGETIDLIYEGVYNPVAFIVGRGFGGYYIDDLGLFNMLDLTQGAFSEDIVSSGKFRTAHSMIPATILYNGIIGVALLFKLGFLYIKKVAKSPYVFVAVTLFFYSFYYNPLLIICSIFILCGAEYDLSFKKSSCY